jgi:hypothetical protein
MLCHLVPREPLDRFQQDFMLEVLDKPIEGHACPP